MISLFILSSPNAIDTKLFETLRNSTMSMAMTVDTFLPLVPVTQSTMELKWPVNGRSVALLTEFLIIPIGPTRKVDVMDVSTQRSLQMTMHQWAKYFESNKRDTLLNVISLEISKTPLCDLVSPPDFVSNYILYWVLHSNLSLKYNYEPYYNSWF